MDEKNILKVYNEQNEPLEIEVLDIFTTEKYPDKQYILYTQGETEGENVKCYIANLKETESSATIETIEDNEEFDYINNLISSEESE